MGKIKLEAVNLVDGTLRAVYLPLKSVLRMTPAGRFVDTAVLLLSTWSVIIDHRRLAKEDSKNIQSLLKNRLYREAALMANDVYEDESKMFCGGWEESHEFQDLCFNDEKSGLKSRLYCRTINGRKEYMYATAGTITVNDWKHNILQIIGQSSQYEYSVENAKVLSERVKAQGGKLYFTGHSQGGGEAICNALATGCKAIVFNPAGVSSLTIAGQGADKGLAEEVVTCFIVDNDPLNIAQDALDKILSTGFPVSIGKRIYVKSTKATWESHLIEVVLQEFANQLPYDA